jgi:hypothetical protein
MIDITNVAPFRPRPEDPTAALRARRARRKRKAATSTTAPTTVPSVTVGVTPEHIPTVTSSVTPPLVSLGFPGGEDNPERHGGRHSDTSGSDNVDGDWGNLEVGRFLAVRNAARKAASLVGPESGYVARLLRPVDPPADQPIVGETPTPVPVPSSSQRFEEDIRSTSRSGIAARIWSATGRAMIGLAIVSTGAFIAYTSMRANSWFGHSLTPDPAAGEVYSHLSVAAEVIACLIPTATRFYWQDGDWWTALRGWVLMAVALVVVFFAAGGFALTNLNAGVEARAQRQTAEIVLAQRRLDTGTKSRAAECAVRGPLCRKLEAEEQAAIASLEQARADVKAEADPQAAALGISSAGLRVVQAGALVALCLFSGLFISFGAGLIWRSSAKPVRRL